MAVNIDVIPVDSTKGATGSWSLRSPAVGASSSQPGRKRSAAR